MLSVGFHAVYGAHGSHFLCPWYCRVFIFEISRIFSKTGFLGPRLSFLPASDCTLAMGLNESKFGSFLYDEVREDKWIGLRYLGGAGEAAVRAAVAV